MPPRSHRWHECNIPDRVQDSGPLALVFEDDELFEAETAEFTIEDADDFAASLLLNNDGVTGAICPQTGINSLVNTDPDLTSASLSEDHQSCADTDYSMVVRHFHILIHSAHNLAMTSVVTPTQHAQMTECKLISVTGSSLSMSTYPSSSTSMTADINCSDHSLLPCGQSNLADSSFPVHVLTAISHSSVPRSPTFWPECVLAYTDAPALVRAIASDLEFYREINGLSMGCFELTSCDQTPSLTTCTLTCCQADIEVVMDGCEEIENNIHVLANSERLRLSQHVPVKLCAYSGLRPEHSTSMTAIYLILVQDDQLLTHSSQFSSWDTDLFVLAMLVSLMPSSVQSANQLPYLDIDHTWIRPLVNPIAPGRKLIPLVALVDIVQQTNADGTTHHRTILHQRLHHLTEFNFTISTP